VLFVTLELDGETVLRCSSATPCQTPLEPIEAARRE
jgi:hypothetical protein